MAIKMLPQDVADAFVNQYYAILNKCPENIHKFYQEASLLGWPGPDGVLTPVTTLSGINEKVMSSDFKNCSVEVRTLDSQESVDGGIIVAVTGSLTGTDNVKKNFSQTFFLAKQVKGFFVLNDILRLSDVINTVASHDEENDNPTAPIQSSDSGDISDSPSSLQTKLPVENEKAKEESDLSVSEDAVAKDTASVSHVASSKKASSVVPPIMNAKVHQVVAPPSSVTPKVTYASMVAKETYPIIAKVASVASSTTKAPAPLSDGALKVSTPSSDVPKALTFADKVAPKIPVGGNVAPNYSAYVEARGIYIGRLPYDITKQGIVEVVKKFGPVRRNSDTVQIRRHEDGFCCGFVEFEHADSARRAVEAHHIKFGEKEAYITYKRSSSSKRGNDGGARSPTNSGFRTGKFRASETEATKTGKFQKGNWADQDKGRARGPRLSGQGR